MSRITARDKYGVAVFNFSNPIVTARNCSRLALDGLACFEEGVENGTVIDFQCKVGDTVYWAVLLGTDNEYVLRGRVRGLSVGENGTTWFSVVYENGLTFEHTFKDYWNKDVFLDEVKAELRLKELRGR